VRRPPLLLPLPLLAALALACSSSRAPAPPTPEPPRPPSPEELLREAIGLRAAGEAEAARTKLEAALAASPRADPVRNELADLLVADGRDLDRAAEVLAGADAASAGPRYHLLSGRLAELRGDGALAVDAYARALALGADPELRYDRARLLGELGRNDEAIQELLQLREARRGRGSLEVALAERYEDAGRLAEAETEYRRNVEAAPDRPLGWTLLSRFLARHGREEEARDAEARARERAGGAPARALRPLPPSRR
jgi:tetratricopeptide (TPR) repeat protein